MKNLLVRVILIGLASFLLWVSNFLLSLESKDLFLAVKALLSITVLLLISVAWVCFTVWFTIELHSIAHLIEKTFKKVVDYLNRKR